MLKKLIITLVLAKNTIFVAENCRESQEIVSITSTPGYFRNHNIDLAIANDLMQGSNGTFRTAGHRCSTWSSTASRSQDIRKLDGWHSGQSRGRGILAVRSEQGAGPSSQVGQIGRIFASWAIVF
jgi:hypothetical protein